MGCQLAKLGRCAAKQGRRLVRENGGSNRWDKVREICGYDRDIGYERDMWLRDICGYERDIWL
jgi:hypothetical protein